jgi:hypothetical protein
VGPLRSLRLVAGTFWSGLHQYEKIAVAWLWAIGGVLLVGGLVADGFGWWDGHAFLLNATSSAMAFCVGAPIAVVVLRRLSGAIEDESRIESQHLPRLVRLAHWECHFARDEVVGIPHDERVDPPYRPLTTAAARLKGERAESRPSLELIEAVQGRVKGIDSTTVRSYVTLQDDLRSHEIELTAPPQLERLVNVARSEGHDLQDLAWRYGEFLRRLAMDLDIVVSSANLTPEQFANLWSYEDPRRNPSRAT